MPRRRATSNTAAALLERRLIFVTGKGGTGKTSVAAALALLASEQGKRVLICEAEPRGDLTRVYECGTTSFVPRAVAPRLYAMSMDTEASLREYLRLNLHVPSLGWIAPLAHTFDFLATAAPGIREILTVGKLCYEVRENHFDLVVVDAAATGHIIGELAAPAGINELVRVGAVKQQTRWMLDILSDERRTGAVIVTTPEEMPTTEAIELATSLSDHTPVHLAAVVANRVLPELFGRGEQAIFDELSSTKGVAALGGALGEKDARVSELLEAATLAVKLRRSGAEHLETLRANIEAGTPLVYLPYLFARPNGPRAVRLLAEALAEELS